MEKYKEFFKEYSGAIIGALVGVVGVAILFLV